MCKLSLFQDRFSVQIYQPRAKFDVDPSYNRVVRIIDLTEETNQAAYF